jgi:hypothetical protein
MAEFEKVEVPTGRFIGWGPAKGPSNPPQTVTVNVIDFDATGGKNFNGDPCPQLMGTLAEDATNYRDKGATKETIEAGELVTVTAGTANLKKGLLIADPKRGDLVRMSYNDTYQTAQGDGKVIAVEIARGAGADTSGDKVSEDDL